MVSGGRATGVRLASGEAIVARKAVIGQIHPWLLGEMVEGVDPGVAKRARDTRVASFGGMIGHLALSEPPRYHAGEEAGNAMMVSFAPSNLEAFRRIFDDFRYGAYTPVRMMSAVESSRFDPSRAPPGKAAVNIVGFGPYELRGGAEQWTRDKDKYAAQFLAAYCSAAGNLTSDNIVGWTFETPLDLANFSPTFQRCDLSGVGKYFFQFGGHRPTAELAQYKVPGIEGFYLAGAFMHPPGGITGSGRNTAVKMCGDLGLDFDRLVA